MIEQAPPAVTWIKVSKPTFDLVGVILKSIGATTILAMAALALGILLGLNMIRRRRRAGQAAQSPLTRLNLPDPRRPTAGHPDAPI